MKNREPILKYLCRMKLEALCKDLLSILKNKIYRRIAWSKNKQFIHYFYILRILCFFISQNTHIFSMPINNWQFLTCQRFFRRKIYLLIYHKFNFIIRVIRFQFHSVIGVNIGLWWLRGLLFKSVGSLFYSNVRYVMFIFT